MSHTSPYNPNTETPDLTGEVAIVTGGNAGIGYQTVKHLAKHGAKVYMAARSQERCSEAIASIQQEIGGTATIEVLLVDLSLLKDVKRASEEFKTKEEKLDILVNNAALTGRPKHDVTTEGIETTLVTNHFGHFLLTQSLLPLLKKAASESHADVRIVNMSSSGHEWAPTLTEITSYPDLDCTHQPGIQNGLGRYGLTKMAAIWFTGELQRRFNEEKTNIVVTAVDPGAVATDGFKLFFGKNVPWPVSSFLWFISGFILSPPEVGAYAVMFTSSSSVVSGEPDKYKGAFIMPPNKIAVPKGQGSDAGLARQLYDVSEKVIDQVLNTGSVLASA